MVLEEETVTQVQSTINFSPNSGNGASTGTSSGRSPHGWREVALVRNVSEIFISNSSKSTDHKDAPVEGKDPGKLPIRERLRHFTWAWFTMTMATGGIANVLYATSQVHVFRK
jgi:hypothetical protein